MIASASRVEIDLPSCSAPPRTIVSPSDTVSRNERGQVASGGIAHVSGLPMRSTATRPARRGSSRASPASSVECITAWIRRGSTDAWVVTIAIALRMPVCRSGVVDVVAVATIRLRASITTASVLDRPVEMPSRSSLTSRQPSA